MRRGTVAVAARVMAACASNVFRPFCLALVMGCATRPAPLPPPPRPRPPPVTPLAASAPPEGVLRQIPLRGGRTLTLRADGALVRHREGETEQRLAVEAPAGCALQPWGERGFVTCEGDGASVLFPDSAPSLAVLRGALSRVRGGRDGRTLFRDGPCEADRVVDATRESAGCRWSEGAGWRTWTVDQPRAQLLDVYGQRALLRWAERTELPERPPITHEVVGLYDIDSGRWIPLTTSDPTARWVCAGFGDDGAVRAILHTGTEASPQAWRAVGDEGRGGPPRLQARPLPFAAEDFAELDEQRMVLVRDGDAVFLRDERHAVPVRGEGSLSRRTRRGATRCGERVRCEGLRCVIDGIWELTLPPPRDPLAL